MKLELHENDKTIVLIDEDGNANYVTPKTLPSIILIDMIEYIKNSLIGVNKT